jgi:hypothetical protein
MTARHQKGYLFRSIFLVVLQVFFFQIVHLTFRQLDGFAADGGLSAPSKNNIASCQISSIESDQTKLSLIEGEEATITITTACKSGDLPEGIKVTARINKNKNRISLSSKSGVTDVNGEAKFTVTARKKGIARIVFKAGRLKAKVIVKVEKDTGTTPTPLSTPTPVPTAILTPIPPPLPTPSFSPVPTPTLTPVPTVTTSVWTKEDGIRLQPSDAGLEAGSVLADISVIKLSDDTYRAYFATNEGIRSATSDDGLTFTVEDGFRLPEGYGMPRVVRLDDGSYRLFAIVSDGITSAVSDDGLEFTVEEGTRIKASDFGVEQLSGGSLVELDDGTYRMYFSDLPKPGEGVKDHQVFSATSSDMLTWTAESGVRVGSGSGIDMSAEHPFVIKQSDGTFRMFYYRNNPTGLWTATSTDGLTWEDEESTGITEKTEGNDPDVVILPDGRWRLYYGDFDESIGGLIYSAVASPY